MKRIALGIQYDGTPWQGWQTQPHRQTVQDVLEAALEKFLRVPTPTTCAGRTDAGVHATGQVVHFDTEATRELFSWVRGVNAFLPDSVAVRWAAEVEGGEQGFHARFSATARTYHYVIHNDAVRSPLWHGRAGWTFRPLDAEAMHAAYRGGLATLGTLVRAEMPAGEDITGRAVDVERDGRLVVIDECAVTHRIDTADVVHLRPAP